MQTVLFDLLSAQPIGSSKFHGGGEYIKIVYKNFIENYSKKCKVIAFYDKSRFIDEYILELNNKYKIQTLDIKYPKQLESMINRSDCDVLFMGLPYAYAEIQFPKHVYKISVIHGLRYAEMPIDKFSHLYGNTGEKIKAKIKQIKPEYFKERALNVYSKVYKNSDYVIVDSKHTLYSLKTWLGEKNVDKVHVLYPPLKVNTEEKIENINSKEYGKYIFMISANRWEKNSYRAIQALENLFSKGYLSEYKVVICGNLPPKIQIQNKKHYIFKGYVSTEELNSLYLGCDIFFYPTLNEGFGYPPLEAMKYGRTCVVSAVCSLPEICGDAVYYVNPFDIKEMENRLLWATEEKIDETIVKKQFTNINHRQVNDLHKVCEVILGGYKQ